MQRVSVNPWKTCFQLGLWLLQPLIKAEQRLHMSLIKVGVWYVVWKRMTLNSFYGSLDNFKEIRDRSPSAGLFVEGIFAHSLSADLTSFVVWNFNGGNFSQLRIFVRIEISSPKPVGNEDGPQRLEYLTSSCIVWAASSDYDCMWEKILYSEYSNGPGAKGNLRRIDIRAVKNWKKENFSNHKYGNKPTWSAKDCIMRVIIITEINAK